MLLSELVAKRAYFQERDALPLRGRFFCSGGCAEAEAVQLQAETEARVYAERQKAAEILQRHPALLRLAELETLRELAGNANARIYLGLDRTGLRVGGAGGEREGS